MKKNNYFLRRGARIASVMIIGSSLAIIPSCYDDGDLKDSISNLEDRVTGLEEQVAKMQLDITSIRQIADAINSGSVVTSVIQDENGDIIVSYSNDMKTVIAAQDLVSKIPVITVVEEDGVYYWATSVDGVVTPLSVDGKKMPVTGSAPMIRINPDSNEWEISTDGGATWETTGVVASGDVSNSVFESVDQDDSHVYFNLVGGTQIKIAKETNISITILGGKQYFEAGQSKVVPLSISGVFKYSLSKPDGWKVSINSEGLNITAPVAENTYAEQGGVVAITAVSADGKSVIEEVKVLIGEAPVKIVVDGDMVAVTRSRADIYTYYLGICKASEFTAEKIDEILSTENPYLYQKNTDLDINVAEITSSEPIQAGVDYIIWAVTGTRAGMGYNIDDLVGVAYYKEPVREVLLDIKVSGLNASISAEMKNCNEYFVGAFPGSEDTDYNLIIENITSWAKGDYLRTEKVLNLEGLKDNYGGIVKTLPGSSFKIWTAPVKDGGYKNEDFRVFELTLDNVEYNSGSAKVEMSDFDADITSLRLKLNPSANAARFYYSMPTSNEIGRLTTEAARIEYLLKDGMCSEVAVDFERSYLSPLTAYSLWAVAIDTDGKPSGLIDFEVLTKGIDMNGTASAQATLTASYTSSSISFTPSGNVKEYRYMHLNKNDFTIYFEENEEKIKEAIMLKNHWAVNSKTPSEIENNTLSFSGMQVDSDYYFFAMVVDEKGALHPDLIRKDYKTLFYKVIRSSADDYLQPSVNITNMERFAETLSLYTVTYDITPAADAIAVYVYIASDEELKSLISWKEKVKQVLNRGEKKDISQLTGLSFFRYLPDNLLLVCQKDEDTIYETYINRIEESVE